MSPFFDCLLAWQYSCDWPFYHMITRIEWSCRCSLIRSINDCNARLESATYLYVLLSPPPLRDSSLLMQEENAAIVQVCSVTFFHVTKSILYPCGYLITKIKSRFDVLAKDEWQSDKTQNKNILHCMNVINTIKIMYLFCFRPGFQGSPSRHVFWVFLRKVVNPFWVI